MHSKLKTDP